MRPLRLTCDQPFWLYVEYIDVDVKLEPVLESHVLESNSEIVKAADASVASVRGTRRPKTSMAAR